MSTLVKDRNGDWKQAAGNYSVWSGTRAELEAALAGGTIPNGTVAVVTDDYAMQGVSCVPDWDNSVEVTQAQIYNGYTCPDNGILVGTFGCNVNGGCSVYVNSIIVSVATYAVNIFDERNPINIPVKKGDVVSTNSVVYVQQAGLHFVPWKK